jgi:hypothetical protein
MRERNAYAIYPGVTVYSFDVQNHTCQITTSTPRKILLNETLFQYRNRHPFHPVVLGTPRLLSLENLENVDVPSARSHLFQKHILV